MSEVGSGENKEIEEKETEEKENEELTEIPEDWKTIPIQDYFDKGFRPYIRISKGRRYITLKRGRYEKSLGPYSEERWKLLLSLRPEMERMEDDYIKNIPEPKTRSQRRAKSSLLNVRLDPPPTLPRSIQLHPRTLAYYEWAVSKGYDKSIGDFLNEVCYAYFLEKGIEPVIYVVKKEGMEEELKLE